MEADKATPTGCYKCGRPGHWSRDCPDSSTNPNPNPNISSSNPSTSTSIPSKTAAEKPKKVPRSRPKLTADILLEEDGLGYVLRHFPRNFKYRGRRHEVEQVASTKRVRTCLKDLRERVASGVDPKKLHESPHECADLNVEQAVGLHDVEGLSSTNHDADVEQEDILHDIFDKTTKEPAHPLHGRLEPETPNNNTSAFNNGLLTFEQRARMEANRLKALERAAARANHYKKAD